MPAELGALYIYKLYQTKLTAQQCCVSHSLVYRNKWTWILKVIASQVNYIWQSQITLLANLFVFSTSILARSLFWVNDFISRHKSFLDFFLRISCKDFTPYYEGWSYKKRSIKKRLLDTENLFRKNLQLKDVC